MDNSNSGSPLSDIDSTSDPFEDEEGHPMAADTTEPPAKRQKLAGESSLRATPVSHPVPDYDNASISSDTSGDIPSPINGAWRPEDDEPVHEQVTVCLWADCDAGDLGNMDKLVEHIHNEHIETSKKKYTCEWSDCSRRGHVHASGYALKSHMRSHTREKPFYCALPECDRSFTRSDALAKHLRTVHETEALRPSDPIPKTFVQTGKLARSKNNSAASYIQAKDTNGAGPVNGSAGYDYGTYNTTYPPELGFTEEEEAMGPKELNRLLRRQAHWADEETESLKKQLEVTEDILKQEWMEKEVVLDQVINNEVSWHDRRKQVLAGRATLPTVEDERGHFDNDGSPRDTSMQESVSRAPTSVPLAQEDQREAAAVLASLHQA